MTRAYGAVVFVLLALAAAVQLNDPDPLRWLLFYGIGALIGLLALFARLWWKHALGYAVLGLGVGLVHLVLGREGLGANWLDDELVREGLGALIAGGLVAVLAILRRRDAPHQASPYVPAE